MYVKFVLTNFAMKCRRFLFQFAYLLPLLFLLSKTLNSLCAYRNNDQMSFILYNWQRTCYFRKMMRFFSQVYLNGYGIFYALYFWSKYFIYQMVYRPVSFFCRKGAANWHKSSFLLYHNSVGFKDTELRFYTMILLDGKQKHSNQIC